MSGTRRGEVLLFQPRIGYMDTLRSKPSMPLSLIHAASELHHEFDVRIIDQRLDRDWAGTLAQAVRRGPLYVGITAITGPMIGHGLDAARVVRTTSRDVPIVWGGPHPTLVAAQTLQHPLVDAVVVGDGERPALEIARRRSQGRELAGLAGVGAMREGRPVFTPPEPAPDLDRYAPAPFHLIDIDDYTPLYQGRRSLYFQTSRGCPHACRYCYNTVAHPEGWRGNSAERVLEQLHSLVHAHGVEEIYFIDDNFFIDRARARTIAEGLLELDCTWQVQGADLNSLIRFDAPTLRLLQQSGCKRFSIGVESGSPRIREQLGKRGSPDEIVSAVARLAPYGFVVFGSFMTNLPGETREDLESSVRLMERLHRANPNFRNSPFYRYTPFPGTPLFEDAVEDGFLPPRSLEDWAKLSYEGNTYVPAGSPGNAFHAGLYFCTLLNDAKLDDYADSALLRILARAYRPVARFRLRHMLFSLMPERHASRLWY